MSKLDEAMIENCTKCPDYGMIDCSARHALYCEDTVRAAIKAAGYMSPDDVVQMIEETVVKWSETELFVGTVSDGVEKLRKAFIDKVRKVKL